MLSLKPTVACNLSFPYLYILLGKFSDSMFMVGLTAKKSHRDPADWLIYRSGWSGAPHIIETVRFDVIKS